MSRSFIKDKRDIIDSLLKPRLFAVTILVATMTFEDFILKWLPASPFVYSISRFLSELLIYGLFAYFVVLRILAFGEIRRTRIDIALLAFLALAIMSVFMNDAPILGSVINLKALVRYVALFYVVVNLDLTPYEVRSFLVIIVIVGVLQSTIGLIQVYQGGPTAFWLPRASELQVAGYAKEFTILTGGVEKGAVVGAFGYTVSMALYLLIAIICSLSILLESNNRFSSTFALGCLGAMLIVLGIFFTYSRAAVAALALALPFMLWFSRRTIALFQAAIVAGIGILAVLAVLAVDGARHNTGVVKVREQYITPVRNIEVLFSSEYWERTEGSRQWLIKEVGSSLIRQGSLIGFGSDEETARRKIVERAGGTLGKLITYKAFEDVYWVAMLAYYGLVGLVLYMYVLWRLFRCSAAGAYSVLATSRVASVAFGTLLFVTIPLTFIIQTFEIRAFGFYFWFLAALMYTEYERSLSVIPVSMTFSPAD